MSKFVASFVSFLTALFVVWKLDGFINWSWVWVLSPIWICTSSVGIMLLVMFLGELLDD